MKDSKDLVKAYLSAIESRDFEQARLFLADKNFTYTSPIANYDNADQFIRGISAVGPILEQLTIRSLCMDSSRLITIVDARITLHGYVTRTSALIFELDGGKISGIEAIFDATEYHRMIGS